MPKPCCYDCLSEDVAVKVIDEHGFEHWFCAEDWASEQELHEAFMKLFDSALGKLRALESQWNAGGSGG